MLGKVIRIGTVDVTRNGRNVTVYCKIETKHKDGKGTALSISGVVGPCTSGNAAGGCGQIVMEWRGRHAHNPPVKFADGWNQELFDKFLDIWDEWHLNDMTAGCEHQTGWGKKDLEILTYRLTSEVLSTQNKLKERCKAVLKERGSIQLTPAEQGLLSLRWERHDAPDADGPGSGCYEVHKRETKRANWVRQSEHPEGVLCKPCPTCGYKYGSAWKHKTLPKSVIDFLTALPETDKQPAWV